MERKIVGFERDDEGHWVARLDCGHGRHVRHIPPLAERPWALTEQGRREKIGLAVRCPRCDDPVASIQAGTLGGGDKKKADR